MDVFYYIDRFAEDGLSELPPRHRASMSSSRFFRFSNLQGAFISVPGDILFRNCQEMSMVGL